MKVAGVVSCACFFNHGSLTLRKAETVFFSLLNDSHGVEAKKLMPLPNHTDVKCESGCTRQRQSRTGLCCELCVGAFWLTVWSSSWKLVYHLLCMVYGSAETFMPNKISYSKAMVYSPMKDMPVTVTNLLSHSQKVLLQKELVFIFWNRSKIHDMVLTNCAALLPTIIQCFR